MNDRLYRRKQQKETKSIIKKAKRDMASWLAEVDEIPSEKEILAWQSGYLYGINRGVGNTDDN